MQQENTTFLDNSCLDGNNNSKKSILGLPSGILLTKEQELEFGQLVFENHYFGLSDNEIHFINSLSKKEKKRYISHLIVSYRKTLGITQQEFADFIGIPLSTIRNWEQQLSQPPLYVISLIKHKVYSYNLPTIMKQIYTIISDLLPKTRKPFVNFDKATKTEKKENICYVEDIDGTCFGYSIVDSYIDWIDMSNIVHNSDDLSYDVDESFDDTKMVYTYEGKVYHTKYPINKRLNLSSNSMSTFNDFTIGAVLSEEDYMLVIPYILIYFIHLDFVIKLQDGNIYIEDKRANGINKYIYKKHKNQETL